LSLSLLFFAVAFLVVIPSGASEPASSRSFLMRPLPSSSSTMSFWAGVQVLGDVNEKRETAGSLAPLGMTTRKTTATAEAEATQPRVFA
jgi:hypothetical protein